MAVNNKFAYLLAALFATSTVTIAVGGCNKDKDNEDEDDDKDKDKDEDDDKDKETDEDKVTEEAAGDVKTYPDMTPAGGTYRLLQPFNVYNEADTASKKLTGLAPGTLVNFKNYYKDWILVEWPSGPGVLSPGWIQVKPNSPKLKVVTTEEIDAAVVVDSGADEVDSGTTTTTEVPDAGTTPPDAGAKPKFKVRLPKLKPVGK
jgi:hypothetical protein